MAYWDRISASKIAPEVMEIMKPLLENQLGNPHSPHRLGTEAARVMAEARGKVATFLGAESRDIIFTSTGTEANHLGFRGLARAIRKAHPKRSRLIVSAVEHTSIMKLAQSLKTESFETVIIPVDSVGRIRVDAFRDAMDDSVAVVGLQLANPEVGTIQPVTECAEITHAQGAYLHCDAIAAAGWLPMDAVALDVDSLSLAASTFHGPSGAAALYLKRGRRPVTELLGGIQERNLRAGSENIPAIAGMAAACDLAQRELSERTAHGRQLITRLREGLSRIEAVEFTGDPENRIPGHVSIIVNFVEGEALLLMLDMSGISAASGSSCTAKDLKISPVLMAMGLDHTSAQGSIVLSASRNTTLEDADAVIRSLPAIVDRLRSMSPLWNAGRSQD